VKGQTLQPLAKWSRGKFRIQDLCVPGFTSHTNPSLLCDNEFAMWVPLSSVSTYGKWGMTLGLKKIRWIRRTLSSKTSQFVGETCTAKRTLFSLVVSWEASNRKNSSNLEGWVCQFDKWIRRWKNIFRLDIVAYTYNPSTWKAEAGRSQVQDQTELHSKLRPIPKKNILQQKDQHVYQCRDENNHNHSRLSSWGRLEHREHVMNR
jgi:hypothetical protein